MLLEVGAVGSPDSMSTEDSVAPYSRGAAPHRFMLGGVGFFPERPMLIVMVLIVTSVVGWRHALRIEWPFVIY